MKTISILLTAAMLAVAGCGDDEETAATGAQQTPDAAMKKKEADDAAMKKKEAEEAAMKKDDEDAAMKKGDEVEIAVGESEFGEMLFDSNKQAIYIFEKDPKGESACYGDCAEAWPPVFSDGQPVAGDGVKDSLLGTTTRRDGKLQVTYDGQPLYYYAHEKPGEVRCHNVNLNGGFWWVVGPDGRRRP
jgi:predicted lipoprotein with Yx(FWY)xxD motif